MTERKEDLALELAPRQSLNPMDLLQMALAKDVDLDKLTKLMDMRDRWEAGEAKKAFVVAMAAFKCEPILVLKDKENKQYSSKEPGGPKAMYTSLGNMVNTVTPFLGKHGLSARWEVDQATGIKVTCIVTHALGHSEQVSMTCPVDTSGAKNAIQGIKSSITYAKACTFESICGLASSDANVDDDGSGVTAAPRMADEDYIAHKERIESARNEDELKADFGKAYVAAQKLKDEQSMKAFIRAKDARKAELK